MVISILIKIDTMSKYMEVPLIRTETVDSLYFPWCKSSWSMDYASLHGGTRVFKVAVLTLTMSYLYKAIYEYFYQSISMWAVDEKQDIKLLWPN